MSRPVCLDITRLVSRAGQGPLTGIDRVELAWLTGLLEADRDVFGLLRVPIGFAVLDRDGLASVPGVLGLEAGLSRRPSRSAEIGRVSGRVIAADELRRRAVALVPRPFAERLLPRSLPGGTDYVNVGHANVDARVFRGIRRAGGASAVLLHDTIPLRLPAMQTPQARARAEDRIAVATREADHVFFPTAAERAASAPELARRGLARAFAVHHLGRPADHRLPDGLSPIPEPYFIAIGTLEPRKNITVLLDLWEDLGSGAPVLCLVGRRGWYGEDVFARLERLRRTSGRIRWMDGADDIERDNLLLHAAGLLQPSLAEGFGLVPVEAAAAGVPMILSPLPVYRELLGDTPIYADPSDRYHWTRSIGTLADAWTGARKKQGRRAGGLQLPTWAEHICQVLMAIEQNEESPCHVVRG